MRKRKGLDYSKYPKDSLVYCLGCDGCVLTHIRRLTGPLDVMELSISEIAGCFGSSLLLKWLRCTGQ